MEEKYFVLDDKIEEAKNFVFPFSNRAFRYGDALFESIRVCNGKIMFLPEHIDRIKLSMTVLRMNVPGDFGIEKIHFLISELLKKNNHSKNARVRMTVFRRNGGLYSPENNEVSFLIESSLLENHYELNEKGLWVDVYSEIKKSLNKLMNLKSANALLYVMAGISKQSMKLDECFILNEKGNVCESISSNVFVVKKNSLTTPPLEDGAVAGVMRKQILKIAAENKLLCFEKTISNYSLLEADEIFLTNAVKGIQWVERYKEKFFVNKISSVLINSLIELAKK